MDVRDELRMIRAAIAAAREAYEVVNGKDDYSREWDVRDAFWRVTDSLEDLADAVQRLTAVVGASHDDNG